MMSQFEKKERLPQLRFLRIGIIVLTVLTGVIHLYLAVATFWLVSYGPIPAGATPEELLLFAILFLLNGVGYMVLVVALYLPRLQRFQTSTRWLLIGYTVLTIVLWYFIEASRAGLFDYSDKLIEAVLIALLLIEGWQTRQRIA
jgi:hypothetical protein